MKSQAAVLIKCQNRRFFEKEEGETHCP